MFYFHLHLVLQSMLGPGETHNACLEHLYHEIQGHLHSKCLSCIYCEDLIIEVKKITPILESCRVPFWRRHSNNIMVTVATWERGPAKPRNCGTLCAAVYKIWDIHLFGVLVTLYLLIQFWRDHFKHPPIILRSSTVGSEASDLDFM